MLDPKTHTDLFEPVSSGRLDQAPYTPRHIKQALIGLRYDLRTTHPVYTVLCSCQKTDQARASEGSDLPQLRTYDRLTHPSQ